MPAASPSHRSAGVPAPNVYVCLLLLLLTHCSVLSRCRYIEYYAALVNGSVVLPVPPALRLERLRLLAMPALGWTMDGEAPLYHARAWSGGGPAAESAAVVFDGLANAGAVRVDQAAWGASQPSTLQLPLHRSDFPPNPQPTLRAMRVAILGVRRTCR